MDNTWTIIAIAVVVLVVYLILRRRQRHAERLTDLGGRVVFITGCDSGFGHALARRLDGLGVPVIAGCYTPEGGRLLQEECTSRLRTVSLDVTKPESIRAAYEFTRDKLEAGQNLWALVNNAGILSLDGPLDFHTREDFHSALLVNYMGPVQTVQTFLPLLKQSRGRIVNMTSIVGKVAAPAMYPYVGSKFAIKGFTEALRYEMKRLWGIHVCLLMPFGYRTPMLDTKAFNARATQRWNTLSQTAKRDIGPTYLDTLRHGMENMNPTLVASDYTPVVDAYEHAVLAKYPQNMYIVGIFAYILGFVHDFLPQSVSDAIYTSDSAHIMYKTPRHQYQ